MASPSSKREDSVIRVVVMGSAGVGKTTLINQCLYREFVHTYKETVEDTYLYRGNNFELEILDTSGSYNFPDMMKLAVNSGDVFIIVFSVEDYATFDRASELRKEIIALRGCDIPIIIVGNKTDSVVREVSMALADSVVSIEWGCNYHDVTAKDAESVCEVFNGVMNHYPWLYGEKIYKIQKLDEVTMRKRHKKSDKMGTKLRTSLTSLANKIKSLK